MDIRTRRAYEAPGTDDGWRVLVDRLWPRGVKKEDLALDDWARALAPSDALRKWYHHDPDRWEAFQARYRSELDDQPEAVAKLAERVRNGRVTLVFSSKETRYNNAEALRAYLQDKAG